MSAVIYDSPTPAPPLPKTTIFNYLFPANPSKSTYPVPSSDGVAYICGISGRSVTRGDVATQAVWLASGLQKLGMKSGDVGCIFSLNSLEWVNAAMGMQALEMIVSPANPGYTPDELLHQLKDSTAKIIFLHPLLVPVLEKTLQLPEAPEFPVDRIILLCPTNEKPKATKYKSIEEIWDRNTTWKPRGQIKVGEEMNTAYLCYSSGTTGRAKGVETRHWNMTSQVQALNLVYQPLKKGKDVILGLLPFGHIYGLTCIVHQPLTTGVPVVILPRFDEIQFLTLVQKYKITWSLIVPPILIVLIHSKNLSEYDISSLTSIQSGAAPLGADLQEAFHKKTGILVTQGYGLTETSPVVHAMTGIEAQDHKGQVGKLMPTFQARLVDAETGKDVPKGSEGRGELWLRGPSVMKGYWRNQEATKNTFSSDGEWFKTGDVAVIDEDGYYSIVDRVKELIKYKGFQVPPAELEALLLTHPKVADAAVIGIYSKEQATELPRAYITPVGGLANLPKDQYEALSKEVADWVQSKVANHKRLRGGVIMIEVVPKSPSGKILRKDLRLLAKKEMEDKVKSTRKAKL